MPITTVDTVVTDGTKTYTVRRTYAVATIWEGHWPTAYGRQSIYAARVNQTESDRYIVRGGIWFGLNEADRIHMPTSDPIVGSPPIATLATSVPSTTSGTLVGRCFSGGWQYRDNGVDYIPAGIVHELYVNIRGDGAMDLDLPSPWGSLRWCNGMMSTRTPPSGWVRTFTDVATDARGSAVGGTAGDNQSFCVPGCDRFCIPTYSPCFSSIFAGRNAGYHDTLMPMTYRFSWNAPGLVAQKGYQSDGHYVPQRKNLKMQVRWRRIAHNDSPSTYFPLPGLALSDWIDVPFVDTTGGAGTTVYMRADEFTLPAPASTGYFESLGLELHLESTYTTVEPDGVTEHDYIDQLNGFNYSISALDNGFAAGSNPIPVGYSPPTYFPVDVPMKQHGPNETGMTWCRHVGYRPPDGSQSNHYPMTPIAPVLSRRGRTIILQGGVAGYQALDPSYQAAYDAAVAAATIVKNTAYAAALAAKNAAYAAALATFNADTAVALAAKNADQAAAYAQFLIDGDFGAYFTAYFAAEDVYNAAIAGPSATYDAAIAAADADYTTATAAADATYAAAIAPTAAALAAAQASVAAAAALQSSTPTATAWWRPDDDRDYNVSQSSLAVTLRIWSPALAQEWTTTVNGYRYQETNWNGSAWVGTGVYRTVFPGHLTASGWNSEGPAVDLPATTDGLPLQYEITYLAAQWTAGGQMIATKRWTGTPP
jgi:hypothetical protein